MKLSKKVRAVLESDTSIRTLEYGSGVSRSTISRLRSGERQIGNINLETAEKLEEFYNKYIHKGDKKMNKNLEKRFDKLKNL